MEQKFSKTSVQRISIKSLFVMFFFFASALVAVKASEIKSFSDDLKVTPIGVVNGEMSFKLSYDNAAANKLEIVLTDEDGNRLYRQVSSESTINKTFKLDSELETVFLVITNTKDNTQKKFKIISRQRVIERMIVASVE